MTYLPGVYMTLKQIVSSTQIWVFGDRFFRGAWRDPMSINDVHEGMR